MLRNIPPILSPELLKVLAEMGHGDTIVIGDANFAAASMAKKGTLVRKYTARVSIKTWTPKSKAFSCLKYGDEEALRLALEWRDKTIKEINEQGAGYTERHGTKE